MSIRSNSIPIGDALSLQLQDVLRRNGMQAQVTMDGSQYTLYVQGHDSPELSYNISRNQYLAMVDGGTNSSNKKAYSTFVGIVGKDFDIPKNYVHARNANGKVTMGLHGYRVPDRGVAPMPLVNRPSLHHLGIPHGGVPVGMHGAPLPHDRGMLGWIPRNQDGFHMRRIDGRLMMLGSPMIPEREDGYMKPGELQSGSYGFYYKGNQQPATQTTDPLQNLQATVKPVEVSQEPAKKYRDLISSAVYFTNDKWQECLKSHGIVVDAENKKLIMSQYGASYDLTDKQVKELTANSLKGDSVYHRIDIINGVIGKDFDDKLTFDMLNSTKQTDLHYKYAQQQQLQPQINPPMAVGTDQSVNNNVAPDNRIDPSIGVNGQELDNGKGWYRQTAHGREVEVGNIWVEAKQPEHPYEEKTEPEKVKYRMSAVINGEVVSHDITQKQYDKFLALDDYHRMKMFDKIFNEVKMKNDPGEREHMNFGQALMTGLGMVTAVSRGVADIAHDVDDIKHPHHGPEIYAEGHVEPQRHGRIYVKAGLDTPETIASRAFDAGMNQGFQNAMLHR